MGCLPGPRKPVGSVGTVLADLAPRGGVQSGPGAMMSPVFLRRFALESPSPGVEGVSPDLRSRAGRKPILRARVSGPEAARNDHACWMDQPGASACSISLAWPFTNRTTLSHALLVLPRSAIERDLRALPAWPN